MTGLLTVLALFLVAWLWLDTTSARDRARALARRLCEDAGVQLLDQTVSLHRTRVVRPGGGALQLSRHFGFEFSEDGANRHHGELELIGGRLKWAVLEGQAIGRVIVQPH